jgi:pimeloyl-ACP methyl ester carboxylesterase
VDVILIAGLWLPRSIWAEVAAELERLGHRAIPVALPGVDDASTVSTLEDQAASAIAAADSADRPMVVGHSVACSLAWMVADRRPDMITSVVFVGGFPAANGAVYADVFETIDGVMPFPGWGPFEGPDSVDLDEADRARIASVAVPVAEGVAKSIVQLSDDRRFDVPVLVVCPEYGADEAKAWIDAGDVPELAMARHVSFADIDSGHWPMVSRPADLARVLDDATKDV